MDRGDKNCHINVDLQGVVEQTQRFMLKRTGNFRIWGEEIPEEHNVFKST